MGPSTIRVKVRNYFWGLLININNFCFEGYAVFRLFLTFPGGQVVGQVVGQVAGKAEIITNSAQMGLGLRLSFAKSDN